MTDAPRGGMMPTGPGLAVQCPYCHSQVEVAFSLETVDVFCPTCGSTFNLLADTSTLISERESHSLGHFQLDNRVGVGAFGEVWKARDTKLDRIVAVKIPRRGQLDPGEVAQFLREGRAAGQINHSNIVAIHEIGEIDDTPFIVSDFIDGLTLADWLTGQRMTVQDAVSLCRTVAEAIHCAHEKGVIHRDLKPRNILLDQLGIPYVTDFGLAKRESGDVTMTVDGQLLGTPAYMSPEQARGEGHGVDRRSDVYSLGVILYEMLTGERPFRGNSAMLVQQILHDEPPRPRKLDKRVPKALEAVCLKAMSREPQARYQTALEFAEDLGRFLAGQPVTAAPENSLESFLQYCRHPRRIDEASTFLQIVGGVLVIWAILGCIIIYARILFPGEFVNPSERDALRTQQMGMVPLCGLLYGTLIILGRYCHRRSGWAILLASVVMIGALTFALCVLFDVVRVGLGEHFSNVAASKPLALLLTIFAAIGTFRCLAGLNAYLANPNLVRWAQTDLRLPSETDR